MFDNIGGKIKDLAKVLACLGVIASCIVGIGVMCSDIHNIYGVDNILAGMAIIAFGSLVSYLSTFALYGFGELIESNKKIETYLAEIHDTTLSIKEEIEEKENEDNT